VKVVAHEKILARQLADEESAVTLCRKQAEAAVQRGEDHLAREALRLKRDRETVCASLAKQLEESTAVGQTLRRQMESMRRRAEEANRKLLLLATRQRAAKARQRLLKEFSHVPIGGDAFQKFERMCRKVERTEAEADALAELTGGSAMVFESSANCAGAGDNEIEAELEALKAQAGV
jgi:phage shock protein A